MNNRKSKLPDARSLVLFVAFCLIGGMAVAGSFVSFNGQFHFTYPDSWMQVDYQTAEYYLTRGNLDEEVDFEAVFSERETFVLFQGQYLILTVDTIGGLSTEQIDSVVNDLSEEFGRPVSESTPEDFMTGSNLESIVFDRTNNLVSIESEVPGGDAGPRANLLVMKFYEHGIANYYFYTPRIEFEPSLANYKSMATTFSAGEMEDALRSEGPVQVADLDEDAGNSGRFAWMFGGLAMILIIIAATRAKAKRGKS